MASSRAKRRRGKRSRFKKAYYPTPEEIAAECETIRAGWTASEELAHRGVRGGWHSLYRYEIPQGLHFTMARARGLDRLTKDT